MKVYIVYERYSTPYTDEEHLGVGGVYSSEDRAIKRCDELLYKFGWDEVTYDEIELDRDFVISWIKCVFDLEGSMKMDTYQCETCDTTVELEKWEMLYGYHEAYEHSQCRDCFNKDIEQN